MNKEHKQREGAKNTAHDRRTADESLGWKRRIATIMIIAIRAVELAAGGFLFIFRLFFVFKRLWNLCKNDTSGEE